MLSSREIAELEKKYSKYIAKKIIKISIYISIILLILAILAYFFIFEKTTKQNLPDKTETNTTIIKKNNADTNIKKIDSNNSTKTKEKNLQTVASDVNNTEEKNSTSKNTTIDNIKDANNTENIEKNLDINSTQSAKEIFLQDNKEEENLKFNIRPSSTLYTNHDNTKTLTFRFKLKKTKHRKNSQIAPAPLQNANDNGIIMEGENKKAKIDIEISDIDSVQYLKDKLQKTHDISFALMLCRNYYSKKDFKNSLKWSIIANDMDSQNAKSWIWFAKSKYRLNKREDAIKALRAFLKTNDSEEVRSLLRNIVHGELND